MQNRRTRLLMTFICLTASAVLLNACGTRPVYTTGHVAVGAGQVAYSKTGTGTPSIVLQSGLGNGKEVWDKILPALDAQHTVFAYDRPGYSTSKEAQGSRDACSIASELRLTLQQAGVAPPYLLVGHSIGGLYQYVFAKMFPDDVVGVVLLDPTHPRHWETIQAKSPTLSASLKTIRLVSFSSVEKHEFDDQASCLDKIDFKTPLKVPTRVLLRTEYSQLEGGLEQIEKELKPDWKIFTGVQELQFVTGSGHFIQKDKPQDVLNAVASVRDEIAIQTAQKAKQAGAAN